MTRDIIHATHYRGYELSRTSKRALGFFRASLDRLIDLAEAVYLSGCMVDPRAYHFVLDEPNMAKMKGLSNFLARQAGKVAQGRGKSFEPIFYIVVYERRTKKGGEHAHLYLFVDGWGWYETESVARSLRRSGFSQKISVQKRKIQSRVVKQLIDSETGEILSELPVGHYSRFHDLRTEMQDFIQRASYIAKVMTKVDEGRKYSSSHLPAWSASDPFRNVTWLEEGGARARQGASPPHSLSENCGKAL